MREGLGSRFPMATWFAPIEGKHKSFPTGARVVLYLQFLLRPLPLVRPCRARLPLAGSALVGPPLARLSRRAGGPLPFCSVLPPFFRFCFVT